MLIDSHCHLNLGELHTNLDTYITLMQENDVSHALCVGTRPDNLLDVIAIADLYSNIYASVGIHPDEDLADFVLTHDYLLQYISHPKVVAIGETGLDYYRLDSNCNTYEIDKKAQQDRFILHIDVAHKSGLPLIIHTRSSVVDTINIMRDCDAMRVGAVMHCFTEELQYAKQCLDLGFYISISGIVTFKNAHAVQELARYVPLDRLLIETDSPYLTPVPFRGKNPNHPAMVKYVAQHIADLRKINVDEIAHATYNNFFTLFNKARI